jgi:hypothetical protein
MNLIDKTYKNSALGCGVVSSCQIVYLGRHATIPLEKEFIDSIHSLSVEADAIFRGNMCNHRAELVAEELNKKPGVVASKLIMQGWLSDRPHLNEYSHNSLDIGFSFHALAYCKYKNLFIACDCSSPRPDVNPEAIPGRPYVQIFVSEDEDKLLDLLNGIYPFREIYFAALKAHWWSLETDPTVRRKVYSHPVDLSKIKILGSP